VTRAVVVDIEGTTSATEYVVATLFPYARSRYSTYLAAHRDDERTAALIADVRVAIAEPEADEARIVAALQDWTDADAKVTPLKTLQGWIWQEGFARDELAAPCFPDVAPALRAWRADGLTLAVYSSGSVDAQRAWFGHSSDGDLEALFAAHFDTENAGPKREPASYRAITRALELDPGAILFLSDVEAELDAAAACGWQTVLVRRDGEPAMATTPSGRYPVVDSFADVVVSAPR
jgi:enolase-phosphatase E1